MTPAPTPSEQPCALCESTDDVQIVMVAFENEDGSWDDEDAQRLGLCTDCREECAR